MKPSLWLCTALTLVWPSQLSGRPLPQPAESTGSFDSLKPTPMTIWRRPDPNKFGSTVAPFADLSGITLHGGIWANPWVTRELLIGEKVVTYTKTKKNGSTRVRTKTAADYQIFVKLEDGEYHEEGMVLENVAGKPVDLVDLIQCVTTDEVGLVRDCRLLDFDGTTVNTTYFATITGETTVYTALPIQEAPILTKGVIGDINKLLEDYYKSQKSDSAATATSTASNTALTTTVGESLAMARRTSISKPRMTRLLRT